MPARRCSICNVNWPAASRGHDGRCGICGGSIFFMPNTEAISETKARSLRAHADFERWLEAETPEAREQRRARYERQLADSVST